MTMADLAAYRGQWVEPVHIAYQGRDLYELPPPSQDWAALEMLNILEACVPIWTPGRTLASIGPRDPLYWHLMVEAKKLAFADLIAFNADPQHADVPIERLLDKAYARTLCGRANATRAAPTAPRTGRGVEAGDTVVLTTADAAGNMVSLVNSNFSAFGTGRTTPWRPVSSCRPDNPR
jgi:gamma-glutamyltranspeptidase/glutathione hydrolase